MIDMERILRLAGGSVITDMEHVTDKSEIQVGDSEPRPRNDLTDKTDITDTREGRNARGARLEVPGFRTPESNALYSSIENMSVMSVLSVEHRAAKDCESPTSPTDTHDSGRKSVAPITTSQDWACPLGHREFWISAYGLRICSTCHPKPEKMRRTP